MPNFKYVLKAALRSKAVRTRYLIVFRILNLIDFNGNRDSWAGFRSQSLPMLLTFNLSPTNIVRLKCML